jgi:predicted PurR-regulated permease PerM
VYVLVFAVVGGIVSLLIPPVISQVQTLQNTLPDLVANLQSRLPVSISQSNGQYVADLVKELFTAFTGGAELFTRTVGVFNGLFAFVTVLVISFYLVAEENGMGKFVHALFPKEQQSVLLHLIDRFQVKMGRWVLGQLILSVSIFLITFIGLSILGVKYALFLALLAGLLEVVPYIGPFLSAVPAVIFAFIQSPTLALATIVLYIVVQKTEGYVLVPKIMQKTVGTTPLVVLVSLLVGLKLAGVFGLLLAVPRRRAWCCRGRCRWRTRAGGRRCRAGM